MGREDTVRCGTPGILGTDAQCPSGPRSGPSPPRPVPRPWSRLAPQPRRSPGHQFPRGRTARPGQRPRGSAVRGPGEGIQMCRSPGKVVACLSSVPGVALRSHALSAGAPAVPCPGLGTAKSDLRALPFPEEDSLRPSPHGPGSQPGWSPEGWKVRAPKREGKLSVHRWMPGPRARRTPEAGTVPSVEVMGPPKRKHLASLSLALPCAPSFAQALGRRPRSFPSSRAPRAPR